MANKAGPVWACVRGGAFYLHTYLPPYLPYLPTYLLTSYMYLPTASQQKAEILDWRTTLVDRLLRGLEMEAIARYEEFLRIA